SIKRAVPPASAVFAMAIRVSAGSAGSFSSRYTSSCRVAVGCADATARILSTKTVLLLGVARRRPPRRSPVLDPLGIACRPSSLHLRMRTADYVPPVTNALLCLIYRSAIQLLLIATYDMVGNTVGTSITIIHRVIEPKMKWSRVADTPHFEAAM